MEKMVKIIKKLLFYTLLQERVAIERCSSFDYFRAPMRGLTIIVILIPVGCGTITNLKYPAPIDAPGVSETCQPFGGVILDARAGKEYLTNPISPTHGMTELSPFLALYFWGIDLPLSMIGDTITFPIAAARVLRVFPTDAAPNNLDGQ